MRPDGPYNRCGSPALYPKRGRSGRPPVRPAFAARRRQCHRAVLSLAAGGRGAGQGRAARDIALRGAVRAYYRSLFLNSVLVGGVLGDVHRGVTHGRRTGDVVRGLRAVAWERLCGQVIQAVLTAVVLLTVPSPLRPALPHVLAGVVGVAAVAGCAVLA